MKNKIKKTLGWTMLFITVGVGFAIMFRGTVVNEGWLKAIIVFFVIGLVVLFVLAWILVMCWLISSSE